jgi:hypothetical protein
VVGPIGSYDIGDWALLQSNIESIGNKLRYTLFTYDKVKTENIVDKLSLDTRVNEIVDITDIYANGKFQEVEIEKVSDKIKSRAERTEHLLVTGGAYLNRAWGKDFLPTTKLIDVYSMSGLNIGPFKDKEVDYLKQVFSSCNKIEETTLRSSNRSEISDAKKIGLNNINITCDDASFLQKSKESPIVSEQPLLVVNLHPTHIFTSSRSIRDISNLLDEFSEEGYRVVLLPMHYNPNRDLDTLTRVKRYMSEENVKMYNTLGKPNPKKIKKLVSDASLIISSRLHPVVFALSEGTKVIPLRLGKEPYSSLYERKFGGILKLFGLKGDEWVTEKDIKKIDPKNNSGMYICESDKNEVARRQEDRNGQVNRFIERVKKE